MVLNIMRSKINGTATSQKDSAPMYPYSSLIVVIIIIDFVNALSTRKKITRHKFYIQNDTKLSYTAVESIIYVHSRYKVYYTYYIWEIGAALYVLNCTYPQSSRAWSLFRKKIIYLSPLGRASPKTRQISILQTSPEQKSDTTTIWHKGISRVMSKI